MQNERAIGGQVKHVEEHLFKIQFKNKGRLVC